MGKILPIVKLRSTVMLYRAWGVTPFYNYYYSRKNKFTVVFTDGSGCYKKNINNWVD